jgi:hypothetical protein
VNGFIAQVVHCVPLVSQVLCLVEVTRAMVGLAGGAVVGRGARGGSPT